MLFISVIFQLNGSFNRKLFLLTMGNLTGLCWSYTFKVFAAVGTEVFGKIFVCMYTVFFPFLSSIWIVSFWALTLTALHRTAVPQKVVP